MTSPPIPVLLKLTVNVAVAPSAISESLEEREMRPGSLTVRTCVFPEGFIVKPEGSWELPGSLRVMVRVSESSDTLSFVAVTVRG